VPIRSCTTICPTWTRIADTFPMIGLPNDISRTDRAVRAAFESALNLLI
jgi:hypothetical protein